jgi:hypothetical protein
MYMYIYVGISSSFGKSELDSEYYGYFLPNWMAFGCLFPSDKQTTLNYLKMRMLFRIRYGAKAFVFDFIVGKQGDQMSL